MLYKSFDTFFEKFEDLLAVDPVTSRLVIKYCPRKKHISVSLRSDKKVVSHTILDKTEIKNLEAIINRASEVMTNRKVAEAVKAKAKADGKKKKKGGKGAQ